MKYKIIFFFLTFLIPSAVSSCDCDEIINFDKALIVFEGKVKNIRKVENSSLRYEITFLVLKKLKGEIKKNYIKINVPSLMVAACGIEFDFVEYYKVYVYKRKNENLLYTDYCTSTQVIENYNIQ